jgi:hypothetical protein
MWCWTMGDKVSDHIFPGEDLQSIERSDSDGAQGFKLAGQDPNSSTPASAQTSQHRDSTDQEHNFFVCSWFELRVSCLLGRRSTRAKPLVPVPLFFAVWRFELRALHMLGRYSINWAMPQPLFALVIFWIGSTQTEVHQPRPPSSWDHRCVPSCQLICTDGVLLTFCPGWP